MLCADDSRPVHSSFCSVASEKDILLIVTRVAGFVKLVPTLTSVAS